MKLLRTLISLTLIIGALPLTAFATTPVASSFSTTVAANRQNAIQLQGSDAEGAALTYATTSTPSHGTLSNLNSSTGVVVYAPTGNYVGADSFTYTVTSGGETSTVGTVTLSVTNAKTRIIDTLTDPSGAPRQGKVTFILTQPVTSPGGLIAKGASVSATINGAGQFDISVYPSRSLSPVAYYQVYVADNNGGQTLLGIYDIPLSTATINIAPYKVLDTNLAAQYTFASLAAVESLSTAISGAVYASMTSGNVTTALGYTPLRPSNNLSEVSSAATARTNLSLGNVDNTSDVSKPVSTAQQTALNLKAPLESPTFTGTVAGITKSMVGLGNVDNTSDATKNAATATLTNKTLVAPSVTGDLMISGGVTASNIDLLFATKSMLARGLLPYSPEVINGFYTFLDASELNLADGATVASWTDLSGHGRHATQSTENLKLTYHATESLTETPRAYVSAAGTTQYATVPIPATATKTIFLVAKDQPGYPTSDLISIDANNRVSMLLSRWFAYKKSAAQGTIGVGYTAEWSVICLRQNSATSLSLFVDGELVETFTPHDSNWSAATSFKIGAGAGKVRQVAVLDYALTDDSVEEHTNWLRATNGLTWEFEFIDVTGTFAPMLASPGLIIKPTGFKGPRPLVLLNHQAGATERVFLDNADRLVLVRAMLKAGYVVAISRLYNSTVFENTWGNDDSLTANADLYNHIVSSPKYSIDTTKVAMVGQSMGGLTTMLAFPDGRIPLKGAACYDCVLDLAHVYANGFTSAINAAYGIPGSGNYATRTAGHDPRLLATTSFASKRFLFFRNSGDVTVNPTENTTDFANQISGVATEATVVTTAGTHLSNIEGTLTALMEFLARCFA